jgi:hypothetical protein
MGTGQKGEAVGGAPLPTLPRQRAVAVPPGDSYFERLAAPLKPSDDLDSETPAQREARRFRARMPEGYIPQSGADLTFDPRIAYEIALGVASPSRVFEKYGVTLEVAQRMIATPHFLATIKKYQEEFAATGVTFRLKAKIQAEDLLTHSYVLATDPEVPAAVRADMIKWTAKMADLEPAEKGKGAGGAVGSGFTLNITLAQVPGPTGSTSVIDVTPTLIGEPT